MAIKYHEKLRQEKLRRKRNRIRFDFSLLEKSSWETQFIDCGYETFYKQMIDSLYVPEDLLRGSNGNYSSAYMQQYPFVGYCGR